MMVNYIKIVYIACNVKDADAIARKDAKHLTPREEIYAAPLKEIPTFMEWCDYFFFCGTAVIGPPTEYKDFVDFINLRENYGKMKKGSHIVPAFVRLGQTFLMMALTLLLSCFIDPLTMLQPAF